MRGNLYQDNLSTIALANNGRSTSDRTRHINIRYFFIKQYLEDGTMTVEHCPATEMIADILTKPLQGYEFIKMRDLLLGHNRHEFAMRKWNWKLWGVLENIMFLLIFYLTESRSKTVAAPVWSSVYLSRSRGGVCLSVSISRLGFWRWSVCTVWWLWFNIWVKPFTILHNNQTLYKR